MTDANKKTKYNVAVSPEMEPDPGMDYDRQQHFDELSGRAATATQLAERAALAVFEEIGKSVCKDYTAGRHIDESNTKEAARECADATKAHISYVHPDDSVDVLTLVIPSIQKNGYYRVPDQMHIVLPGPGIIGPGIKDSEEFNSYFNESLNGMILAEIQNQTTNLDELEIEEDTFDLDDEDVH